MKILYLKKDEAKIRADTIDDLWHLSRLIEPSDEVAGEIVRKVKLGKEEERARVKRQTYLAKIKAEKVEFEPSAVRVSGVITEGPEELALGSHHTLDIRPGDTVKIFKTWRAHQVKRLKEAEQAAKSPKVLACVLDDELANIAELGATRIKYLSQVRLGLAKKRFAEKIKERMGKLISELAELGEKYDVLVIASPLFWKDEVLKRLKEKHPEIIEKVKLENVSTGKKRGVLELLKRGALDRIAKGSALQKEFVLVENLLIEVAKGGLAKYKFAEVKNSADAGAVKVLLVTDRLVNDLREKGRYSELEKVFDAVESARGEIHIISSRYEAGQKLDGLGGIGAMLRFRV